MTEPTDKQPAPTPEQPTNTPVEQTADPAREPPSKPRRSAVGPAALVLALAALALALAGGYYLWQQLEMLRSNQQTLAAQSTLTQVTDRLGQTETQLRQSVEAANRAADNNRQMLGELDKRQDALARNQTTLQERLGRLDVETRARQGEWLRSEAAYLANLAIARVNLQRDVDGALAALKLADDLLARLNTQAIEERRAINKAVNALVGVNTPDVTELVVRIDALVAKVDVLPLDVQVDGIVEPQQAPETQQETAPTGWQNRLARAWQRFKDTLGQLVIVQRGEPVEPLIAPEERYFLYHNLRLRLESARLALLEGNEAIYRRSLDRSAEWIERYYATGEPAVESALAEIERLSQVEIRPDLPQLAPLLQPVTRY